MGNEIFIDPDAACVLVRIFELHLEGHSYPTIAGILNAEGVPPPRASSARRRRKGWIGSTVRAMLLNAAYAGEWTYGSKEWRRDPDTRKRLARKRQADEVLRDHRPHLRIVPPDLWIKSSRRCEQLMRATHARRTVPPKGARNLDDQEDIS